MFDGFTTYRSIDLFDKFRNIEDAEECVLLYLCDDVFNKLNELVLDGKAPKQSFYDVDENCFSSCGEEYEMLYHTDRHVEKDSIAKDVLIKEMNLGENILLIVYLIMIKCK